MNIIAFSDVHGNKKALEKLLQIANENDAVIFAGDGISCLEQFKSNLKVDLYCVKGNCDISTRPNELILTLENKKVLITHGHLHGVKYGLEKLYFYAKERDCDLVIYGHTHRPTVETYNGITFVNGGCCGYTALNKTFAYVSIYNDKIFACINDTLLN